ncbi:AraC family transcriptional regulator [Rasiella rasia]|uniref:AraC family transcriptional regulator n=1 Tax=Rasiella rasia TaxID=2744027 RepID=A0A6G6GM66_9FLAO|nr:helix-turn-helix domain-containing protein [Rasiella rasia]QIE59638.1 AraC family transcriptional regulator [Rasiella rasia]
MNSWELIFLFFAFQSMLFAAYFFLRNRGDTLSNCFLGAFLVLFSLNLAYNVLYWSKLLFTPAYVALFGYLSLIWITYPILIYMYARRVVTQIKVGVKDLVHLLPILFVFWCYSPIYFLSSEDKLDILTQGRTGEYIHLSPYIVWIISAFLIFYTCYTFFSFRRKPIGQNKKKWLYWVLGAFSCYVIAMVSYFLISRLGHITTEDDYVIMYLIVLFIGVMTYFALMQPAIFEGLKLEHIIPFVKYKKTGLTPKHSKELKKELLSLMRIEQPYLDGNLRLDDLAQQLNISRHHMSQIINEHFDTNFFDFVNSYRIETAKKLLENDDTKTITDVIYASGFNNRVSFYKAFKRHTGATPSTYKSVED